MSVKRCPHCHLMGCRCEQEHRELVGFATRAIRGVAKDGTVDLALRARSLRRLLSVIRDAADANGIDRSELSGKGSEEIK